MFALNSRGASQRLLFPKMAHKAHLQKACIWLGPCRWLIPQGQLHGFPRRSRVYPVLAGIQQRWTEDDCQLSSDWWAAWKADPTSSVVFFLRSLWWKGELLLLRCCLSSSSSSSGFICSTIHHTACCCIARHKPSTSIYSACKSVYPHFAQQNHGNFVDAEAH